MASLYRIGEFARLGGLTPKTLRFYDQIGLFRPASVHPLTRYRLYEARQLEELASIVALKTLGVPLASLRSPTASARSPEHRRELLLRLRQARQASIEAARRSLEEVDAALEAIGDSPRFIPVVIKRRPALAIASIRARIDRYLEVEALERHLHGLLPPDAAADVRGVLWHRCADSDYLEAEPFVALRQRVPPRSDYELKQLPAATLACAYSGLDDESSEGAYRAIRKWMSAKGHRLAGAKREIYLDQMLEIQFPLESA